ncbi:MAG: hypothetical protein KGZ25_07005, partial [Planctomycetes bacterium]|nr:hypothetical protein [Planctomycetota bacterium]
INPRSTKTAKCNPALGPLFDQSLNYVSADSITAFYLTASRVKGRSFFLFFVTTYHRTNQVFGSA